MKTFKYLSPESKVWIYQSSREFSQEEHTFLKSRLVDFCKQWTAHNIQLVADFDIVYDRFIVLIVDEADQQASGCSIDKSVHFLQEMGKALDVNFFDKLQMAYMQYGELLTTPYASLKEMWNKQIIDENTLFFDTNIEKLSSYMNDFLKPLKKHWLIEKIA
jgi:hypothetical protein